MEFTVFKKKGGREGIVVSERDSVMTGWEREYMYIYVNFLRFNVYNKASSFRHQDIKHLL